MKWFRFYHEAIDDPKVQRLEPVLFKFWINMLCLASRSDERGTVKLDTGEIAFALRISDEEAETNVAALVKAGLLEEDDAGLGIHAWNNRQFKSDDVSARVTEHRNAEKQGESTDETLQETPDETLQETLKPSARDRGDTEEITETEEKQKSRAQAPKPKSAPAKPKTKVAKEPMPRQGPAQTLTATLYEDVLGIGAPTGYKQVVGQAQTLVNAGCTPDELREIAGWLQSDSFWAAKGITMGIILSKRDNWRSAKNAPATARASPNGKGSGRNDGYTAAELLTMGRKDTR